MNYTINFKNLSALKKSKYTGLKLNIKGQNKVVNYIFNFLFLFNFSKK